MGYYEVQSYQSQWGHSEGLYESQCHRLHLTQGVTVRAEFMPKSNSTDFVPPISKTQKQICHKTNKPDDHTYNNYCKITLRAEARVIGCGVWDIMAPNPQ